jgi:two-component system, cell cycle response regulator
MDEHTTTLPDPLRVLLVEDDPDQRDLIRDTLCLHFQSKCRHEVVVAGTGGECLDQELETFDAVILDYRLPDMTGLDLLARISQRCDAPVIFVTGENVADVAVKAIQAGAQDYVVKMGDYLFTLPLVLEKNIQQHQLRRQHALLQRELTARMEEIRVKNCQLEESLAMLRTAAATDHLTGLFNRRAFAELLDRSYAEALRYDFDLSCVMCDLDHYKNLNDTLGHQGGDRILVSAADVIRDNLRSSDTAARYGGD